jgi:uncharacterized membrane protein YgdD (TMEM256/DUF423 family)
VNLARLLAVLAPLYCAAGVALGAYASHGVTDPLARERLGLAALFAFGHGVALVALEGRTSGLALNARCAIAAGVLLFSGGLAAAALAGLPAAVAPGGGMLLIAGWVLLAIDAARRPGNGIGRN